MSERKTTKLRPRFTLGALLLLVSICAIPLGYVSYRRAHNESRKTAFEHLAAKGFRFELQLSQPVMARSEPPTSSLKRWWRSLTKEDLVPPFTSVNISDSRHGDKSASDDDLLRLAAFPEITSLSIQDAERITDRGMEVVGNLPRLKGLSVLRSPKVTSKFLEQAPLLEGLILVVQFNSAHVSALQRQILLRQLSLENASLTNDNFGFLAECDKLDSLHLKGMPVDGSFLAKLNRNAPMHFLTICGAPLTDENASRLGDFPRLVDLNLSWTPLTGDFLPSPGAWPMIQRLDLQGTRFCEAGKSKLAQLYVPAHVNYPSNWRPIDLRRYETAKLPSDFNLNALYIEEAKANSISVPVYYPPNFQPPRISNCPKEAMAEVIRLLETAKAEHAEWKATPNGY